MFTLFINRFENLLFVNLKRFFLNLLTDFRIFWEDLLVHKFLGESKAFNVFDKCHVNELTLTLVNNIMITDDLRPRLLLCNGVLFVKDTICNQTKSNSDDTFSDEVHFKNFFFFVVDNLIFRCWLKLSRHEAESTVVKESMGVVHRLDVEETFEGFKNIGKQIDGHDLIFNFSWKGLEILIISVKASKSVLSPVVTKISFNLSS